MVTFYIINRLRHHREEQVLDDIPQWLKTTVETMHDKRQFSENALENMVHLSAKSQEYLTRATQSGYSSPSLFIKTFKKLTSFTPNSYRKKLTEFNQ